MLDGTILTLLSNRQVSGLELIIGFFMFMIAFLCMVGALTVTFYSLACLGFNVATISYQRRKEAKAAYAFAFGGRTGNAEV